MELNGKTDARLDELTPERGLAIDCSWRRLRKRIGPKEALASTGYPAGADQRWSIEFVSTHCPTTAASPILASGEGKRSRP